MIQYSFLGRTALPEDGDGASPRNVVFKRIDAAVSPRKLYCVNFDFSSTTKSVRI
jgi:hypothetical protein